MRFLLILLTLVLLPVMVGLHARSFVRHQEPELRAAALVVLQKEGIRDATVDLRYLDLKVAGTAPDLGTVERATAALAGLQPTRLVENGLNVPSSFQADLREGTLHLEGWLPDRASADAVRARLAALRPDLKIDANALHTSVHVRGEAPVLDAILDKLRVEPELQLTATENGFTFSGMLPGGRVRESLIKAVQQAAPGRPVEAASLRISHHIVAAPFAREGALEPFLRSFASAPSPGQFSIGSKEGVRLRAAATAALEAEWLSLLKEATDEVRFSLQLTLYPSIHHMPGYRPVTPLPAEMLEGLKRSLSDFYIVFEPASAILPAAAQARLAGLTSTLLAAGPALRLVVGGHIEGDPATGRPLALARAEQVRSYLVEQGTPATEIQVMAFDPVPVGTPGAPLQGSSVEILIK